MAGEEYFGGFGPAAPKQWGGSSIPGIPGRPTYDPKQFGGRGPTYDANGYGIPGSTSSEQERDRYGYMAGGAHLNTAPTIDRTQSDEARGYQLGALGLLDQRARGVGPSVAGTEAIRAAQSIAAGARGGPGAELAAQRMAGQQAGSTYGDARAKEMAAATGQYFGASSGMRGQDIGLAQAQAEQEARQRALNQQQEQYYEQKRFDVNQSQLNANLGYQTEGDNAWNAGRMSKLAEEKQDPDTASFWLGSDERMKEDVQPLFGGRDLPNDDASLTTAPVDAMTKTAATAETPKYGAPAPWTQPTSQPSTAKQVSDVARTAAGGGGGGGGSGGGVSSILGTIGSVAALAVLLSDERTKDGVEPLFGKPKDAGPDVVPLYEPPGKQLHQSAEGRAFYVDEPTFGGDDRPSLAGSSSKKSAPKQAKAPAAAPPQRDPVRDMTPDEMMAAADKMLAKIKADTDAIPRTPSAVQPALDRSSVMLSDEATKDVVAREAYLLGRAHEMEGNKTGKRVEFAYGGPLRPGEEIVDKDPSAVRELPSASGPTRDMTTFKRGDNPNFPPGPPPKDEPMAGALRAMAPSAYSYKPGFTPPDQAPGERNVGPMAQNMAENPIAATAIKQDPSTGLLGIDRDKALKLTMGGLASLQMQHDEDARKIAALARTRRKVGGAK